MRKKTVALWITGAVLVILFVYGYITYNSLVSQEEKLDQQWAEVQNTYQRRLNLVPNLVNVVKGGSEFEQSTLDSIAAARGRAMAGTSSEVTAENYSEQVTLQDSLAAATNRLIIRIENYPVLKGTDAYAGLQTQLEGTERRIQVARNDFNKAVASYNNKVRSFPSNIVAGLFGFERKEGFEAVPGADKAIKITF